jgi:hypothetical protein
MMEDEEKWFHPKIHTGWDKDDRATKRRHKVLKAHKGKLLPSARSMQALANVTEDQQTKVAARADSRYFFKLHKREVRKKTPRLSR